jgi:hypothetical protein
MDKIDGLFRIWNLELPNLLISVTGGAKFKINSELKNVFCDGLVKAAYSTSKFNLIIYLFF